jgi:hypothetical protein
MREITKIRGGEVYVRCPYCRIWRNKDLAPKCPICFGKGKGNAGKLKKITKMIFEKN